MRRTKNTGVKRERSSDVVKTPAEDFGSFDQTKGAAVNMLIVTFVNPTTTSVQAKITTGVNFTVWSLRPATTSVP